MHLRGLGAGLALALTCALAAGCQGSTSGSAAPATGTTTGTAGTTTGSGTGTSSSTPKADDITDADFHEVQRLLDHRAHAVLHHDKAAFLATVDPQQADLQESQGVEFDNLDQLGVSTMTYAVGTDAFPPDAVGGDPAPTFHPEVFEHVQIARTFAKPVTNHVILTFVRRDGHWLLGHEAQQTDPTAYDAPQERPWFGGPITVATDGDTTVVVDASMHAIATPLAHSVYTDVDADADLLGVPAEHAVLVDATTNGLSEKVGTGSSEEAAAYSTVVGATDALNTVSRGVAGHVIKANPHYISQLLEDNGTLRHELTHYLLEQYSGYVPKWVSEGIAQYVGYYPGRGRSLLAGTPDWRDLVAARHELPVSSLFSNDHPDEDYAVSESAVHYLASTYGIPRFLDLMKDYRQAYAGIAFGDDETPRLLRKVYGISLDTLLDHTWSDLETLPSS